MKLHLSLTVLLVISGTYRTFSSPNQRKKGGETKKAHSAKTGRQYNVLFIAVDDLKPWVSAYGDRHAKTPAMDRLAKEGIVFKSSYCQQAICAATRASILTGLRPDRTRVWDLVTDFRQVNPNAVSMPEYFKNNGYETAGMGKVFHVESAGKGHDAPSWSIPYRDAKCPVYALPFTPNDKGRGRATECADVADDFYQDGKLSGMAVSLLDSVSQNKKPFFLAVGFRKPHLPFVAPKKYWDLYDRNEFKTAVYQKRAVNSPNIAYHQSGELKNYTDIPEFDSYSENDSSHLSIDKQKELIHGYYAAMSYTDAQILKLLNELDRLKIRKNTIVVLWGDHGYHLGDHGLWNKHSDFEQATHTLLMMSVPGKKAGLKLVGLSEFTDVFPTLCALNHLPVPGYLDGISQVPAINNPKLSLRKYALSQYPRNDAKIMGYSIRTKRFRYTEWMQDNFRTNLAYDKKYVIGTEMYDYKKDPLETKSVIGDKSYKAQQIEMKKLFLQAMNRERKADIAYAKIANYQTPIRTDIITGKSKHNAID
jgi:arylsulfatase A-like enzyme